MARETCSIRLFGLWVFTASLGGVFSAKADDPDPILDEVEVTPDTRFVDWHRFRDVGWPSPSGPNGGQSGPPMVSPVPVPLP